jgi:hypothetical protein
VAQGRLSFRYCFDRDVSLFFAELGVFKVMGCAIVILVHASSKTESAKLFLGSDAIPGHAECCYCMTHKAKDERIESVELFRFKGRDTEGAIPRTSKATLSQDGVGPLSRSNMRNPRPTSLNRGWSAMKMPTVQCSKSFLLTPPALARRPSLQPAASSSGRFARTLLTGF